MKRLLFFVLIVLLAAGCKYHDPDDYLFIADYPPDKVLNLSIGSGTIPADGASTVKVEARIPSNADKDKRSVKLTTSAGTWEKNNAVEVTITADAEGLASANLKSSLVPGTALIQGTIVEIVREKEVIFEHAYPKSLEVDPGCFALKASLLDSTTVTVYLKREVGIPSLETVVNFSATDNEGNDIGVFRSIKTSDANGTASAIFSVGHTQYQGIVTITASVDAPGESVIGNASIPIVRE
jgi:hypothetical protein